jgi:hypothetical protein
VRDAVKLVIVGRCTMAAQVSRMPQEKQVHCIGFCPRKSDIGLLASAIGFLLRDAA